MCTIVVSLEPDHAVPLLLLAVRDEVAGRPWLHPAHHWDQYPDIVGGKDVQGGGTWLAVNPTRPTVSCVLNGDRRLPMLDNGRSRGELPLAAAAGTTMTNAEDYSPFHLITAHGPCTVEIASWDGTNFVRAPLHRGLTVIANTGVDPGHPRVSRLTPLLGKSPRPSPGPDDSPQIAWAPWIGLLAAQDVEPDDRQAVIRDLFLPGGIPFRSHSVSLIAVSETYTRYDFIAIHNPPLLTDITAIPLVTSTPSD